MSGDSGEISRGVVNIYRYSCDGKNHYTEGVIPECYSEPVWAKLFWRVLGVTAMEKVDVAFEGEDDFVLGNGASVYVMGCESAVKIGFSENPFKRLQSLANGYFPEPVNRMWISRQRDRNESYVIEQLTHKACEAKRINGELYKMTFDEACWQVKRTEWNYDFSNAESVRQLQLFED